MLETVTVKTFKSLEDVTVELGVVNVFIGPNGSGKSNLLEALGILASAADGRVDDQTLLSRGVRPGLPALYRTAFPARKGHRLPPHLFLGAAGGCGEVRSLPAQSLEGSGTRLGLQDRALGDGRRKTG